MWTRPIYLLREFYELCENGLCQDFLTEAEKREIANKGTMYLTGVFQKADAVNGNGRVYGRRILEREIENFRKLIKENRALGECDHADCVCDTGEILTTEGWKYLVDIAEDERIYSLDTETGEIQPQRITRKIVQDYEGDLLHFHGLNIDIKVTPNHRFFVVGRYKSSFVTAQEIYEHRIKYSHDYIPKLGNWNPPEIHDIFTLPGVPKENWTKLPHELRDKYSQPLSIDMNVWAAFFGLYLAEGHCVQKGNHRVQITQQEGNKAQKIRNLLAQFSEELKWAESTRVSEESGNTIIDFYVYDARLCTYLRPLGKSWQKYIPIEIKQRLSAKQARLLVDWFHLGDGRTRTTKQPIPRVAKEVFTTSKQLIDDLHEVLIKSGGSGNLYEEKDRADSLLSSGRVIKAQHSMHFLHLSSTKGIYLDPRFMSVERVPYSGKVYCVTVPNQTFYCRNNGKAFWSGNSSVVNLRNTSHLITDLWWDNSDVYGKLRILPTPSGQILRSLVEAGVQLGISSRGLGSLEEAGGKSIVGTDFQLITWDAVADPSTPGAFLQPMALHEHHLRQPIFTKADKLNRILNSIAL